MKWKEYKKLDLEEREEYNFKFSEIDYPRANIYYLAILYTLLVSFMAISLVVLKEFVDTQLDVINLITTSTKVSLVILISFFVDYLGQLSYYIYRKRKESKWIKEHTHK